MDNNYIIQVRDDIEPCIAFQCLSSIICKGRQPNGKYTFKTIFNTLKGEIAIYSRQYTKKDSFVITQNTTLKKDDLQ